MKLLSEIKARFKPALAALVEGVDQAKMDSLLATIRPATDDKFGDYQANCAMALGKQLGTPPREIAARIVELVDLDDLCEKTEIAGPGFINLTLKDHWLREQLDVAIKDDRLGVGTDPKPRTVVIDLSSPNVAKPMHVGHIRSTVIGDALAKIHRLSLIHI